MTDWTKILAPVLLAAPIGCAAIPTHAQKVPIYPTSAGCKTVEVRLKAPAGPTVTHKINLHHPDEILSRNQVISVMPPCAEEIIHFDGTRLLMKDGRTLRVEWSNGQQAQSLATREVHGFYAIDRDKLRYEFKQAPRNLGRFLSSYRADNIHKGGVISDVHLGIWKRSDLYVVNVFVLEGKKFRGKLLPVLTSSRPIRSVGYVGMPDAPSGTLFLALENADGRLDLESYNWGHKYFPYMFGM